MEGFCPEVVYRDHELGWDRDASTFGLDDDPSRAGDDPPPNLSNAASPRAVVLDRLHVGY